ncbi:MAG: hypothetical protein KatS3mg114_0888 [Planctomycetaceae bacterium]|jgi:copper chaperone CopZ|nr:MAG: hypothetical protein KatS3mg114_0888 [Planctomycetaceae bacterium]
MTPETHPALETARRVACPSCGRPAKRVGPVTLRTLLKDKLAEPLAADGRSGCDSNDEECRPVTNDTGWRFCDSPDCDVVYFSEEGDTSLTKSQLKVPVGVKETSGERPLCYCFGHSVASIKEELRTMGCSHALEDIRAKMEDPGCHCEASNPSGSCCLGSVIKGIRIAQEELNMESVDVKAPATLEKPSPVSRASTNRGERIAKIGTVLSAILASSCCWLPLVLLAVGVSGAGVAATLEASRPILIVVTFGFLAAAFYFTYRPRKATRVAAHACCAPEAMEGGESTAACWTESSKQRFRLMAVNKVMMWGVTVLAVAFLWFPSYLGVLFGTGQGAAATETMNRSVVQIDGMTCEGCAATVAQAIRQVPGVLAVEVSYERHQAVVGTESCCAMPKDKILAVLQEAGYRGTFVETDMTSDVPDGTRSAGP